MVLPSWLKAIERASGSFSECRLSASWPPTLRHSSQPTWTVHPPPGCYHPHHRRHLLMLLGQKGDRSSAACAVAPFNHFLRLPA